MNAKNPFAVALGKLGAGHKKTLTPAALQQRKNAAQSKRPAKYLPRKSQSLSCSPEITLQTKV
jgi:hypothetical protein